MKVRQWIILCSIFISYLMVGGFIFMMLERQNEIIKKKQLIALWNDIQDVLFERDYQFYDNGTSKESLQKLRREKEAILKRMADVCGERNSWDPGLHNQSEWGFYNSVFYGFTIVTSIGYGHLTPTTDWSRFVTVIFGLIGIPLNGILLSTLGDYFSNQLIKAYSDKDDKVVMITKVSLYLLPGIVLFLFIPAAIISGMEQWSFVDTIYFVCISLTTIGFGDFIAGKQAGRKSIGIWMYKVFIFVWIELGLGYLCMILAFISKWLRNQKLHNVIEKTLDSTKEQFFKDLDNMRRVMEFDFQSTSTKTDSEYGSRASTHHSKVLRQSQLAERRRMMFSKLFAETGVNALGREAVLRQNQLFGVVTRIVKNFGDMDLTIEDDLTEKEGNDDTISVQTAQTTRSVDSKVEGGEKNLRKSFRGSKRKKFFTKQSVRPISSSKSSRKFSSENRPANSNSKPNSAASGKSKKKNDKDRDTSGKLSNVDEVSHRSRSGAAVDAGIEPVVVDVESGSGSDQGSGSKSMKLPYELDTLIARIEEDRNATNLDKSIGKVDEESGPRFRFRSGNDSNSNAGMSDLKEGGSKSLDMV